MMGHDHWIPSEGTGPWEGWSVGTCWMSITTGDSEKVIPFLIAKLPSQRSTSVHVDPFDAAREGELATYALQHTTHKNWYEYKGTNPVINKALKIRRVREQQPPERYLDYPNDQHLLQNILNDRQAIEAIKQYFSKAISTGRNIFPDR